MKLNQNHRDRTVEECDQCQQLYRYCVQRDQHTVYDEQTHPTTKGDGEMALFRFVFLALNIEISQLHGPQRSAATNFSATVAVEEG